MLKRAAAMFVATLFAAACADLPTRPEMDIEAALSSHMAGSVVTLFAADFTMLYNGVPVAIGADGMRMDVEVDPAATDWWGPSDFGLFDVPSVRVTVPSLGIHDEIVTSPIRYFEDDFSYERVGLSPPFPNGGIQVGRDQPKPDQSIGNPNRIDDLPEYDGETNRSGWINVTLTLANGDALSNPSWVAFGTSCVGHDGLPSCAVQDADGDGVPDQDDPFPNSDTSPTVIIGGDDTGVANQTSSAGTFFADLIAVCSASAKNHGQFVRCVSQLATDWRKAGLISQHDKSALTKAAAAA